MTPAKYSIALHPQHAGQLAASGIPPERASARGYVSVDTKKRLADLGISSAARNVPGLLIPMLRVDGSTWGYQYRPDHPRASKTTGRAIKYETPYSQRNGIDVPPGVGKMLGDPSVRLWITEGTKKADCAVQRGLACAALPGVWSWRGTNGHGGKTAVADWADVALNGRRVVLAFDSDVMVKPAVRQALTALAAYLKTKDAKIEYCHLPDDGDGKTGLDDYLAGHSVEELLRLVRPDPPLVGEAPAPDEPRAAHSPPFKPAGSTCSAGSAGFSERSAETGSVLDEAREWLERFICTVDDDDLDLLSLWAAHTHLCFETYTTPRLMLDSAVPGSGKTTVLEHLERLCMHPVQMASLSSPALLTRMLDAGMRTILIDEADRSLAADKEGVGELLAVLNSGYKRGGTRPVLVPIKGGGWDAKEMPTFAPVAMAGNNPNLPEDTKSRSIRVLLLPDVDGHIEDSDWEEHDERARALGELLHCWADSVRDQVRTTKPQLPEGCRGRARERRGPLKRVAEAVGGRWPALVDRLAVEDVQRIEAEKEEGIVQQRPAVVLLTDVHKVWGKDEQFIPTDDLISRLVLANPNVWGDGSSFGKRLTSQRLGRMLVTSYNIHSSRPVATEPRGYLLVSLRTAFRRFGLDRSEKPAEPAQQAEPLRTTRWASCTDAPCAAPPPSPAPKVTPASAGAAPWPNYSKRRQPRNPTTTRHRPLLTFLARATATPQTRDSPAPSAAGVTCSAAAPARPTPKTQCFSDALTRGKRHDRHARPGGPRH